MKCRICNGVGSQESQRSRWIGGGKLGYRSEWAVIVVCDLCQGSGVDPLHAPGFVDVSQLEAFATRGKTAQLRTWPAVSGTVMVSNSRGDGWYAVTRSSCECQGHATAGRCYHRALAIWLHDIEGVPVCRVATIGSNETGTTMAPGPVPAAMEAA